MNGNRQYSGMLSKAQALNDLSCQLEGGKALNTWIYQVIKFKRDMGEVTELMIICFLG